MRENMRLENENKEMKDTLARESDRIAATMKGFQQAEGDFAKNRVELQSLRDAAMRYQAALQTTVGLTRFFFFSDL